MLAQKEISAFGRKTKPEERQKPPEKTKEDKITLLGMSKQLDNQTKQIDNQTKQLQCQLCTAQHALWKCNKYKNMKPEKRYEFVKSLKLCFNCFNNGHMWPKCESSNKCLQKDCDKRHPTSLHKQPTNHLKGTDISPYPRWFVHYHHNGGGCVVETAR